MPGFIEKAEITFEGAPLSHLPEGVIRDLTSDAGRLSANIRASLTTCCLGILGAEDGMKHTHDLASQYPDFRIELKKRRQSILLVVSKGPSSAFVDGEVTALRKSHVGAAIRDMAYQALNPNRADLTEQMIEDAGLLNGDPAKLQNHRFRRLYQVVFQGGHTIEHQDYQYSNKVGEELGLRGFEAISGGGPGTMRGTLKGNRKGFHQQNFIKSRQMGFTAPEIIAAEPPNIYVTDLVILPDIESRLEAFSRKMHAIVFLPGGVGTMEELLLQLGLKMHQENRNQYIPIILSAASTSEEYLNAINQFIEAVLGEDVTKHYKKILNSPMDIAAYIKEEMPYVDQARDDNDDSDEWNRSLHIPNEFRTPFVPSHENVEQLNISSRQEKWKLAAELRKLCKAIVHGSVTHKGMQEIQEKGKYQIHGEARILEALDKLLTVFIAQKRMRADHYEPCYTLHVNGPQ